LKVTDTGVPTGNIRWLQTTKDHTPDGGYTVYGTIDLGRVLQQEYKVGIYEDEELDRYEFEWRDIEIERVHL